jgi:uncharacterized low-complexity protein
MNNSHKKFALAISGAFALSIAATSISAAENPFTAKTLSSGYQVADADMKMKDGKCSTGKCGATKKKVVKNKIEDKAKEGSCSAEKMKEGSCSAEMKASAEKAHEGSCSAEKMKEGSCSAEMKSKAKLNNIY